MFCFASIAGRKVEEKKKKRRERRSTKRGDVQFCFAALPRISCPAGHVTYPVMQLAFTDTAGRAGILAAYRGCGCGVRYGVIPTTYSSAAIDCGQLLGSMDRYRSRWTWKVQGEMCRA